MRAHNLTTEPPGGKRTPISELVPLNTPLVIQIFPVYACNFTCKYCTFSIPKKKRGFISDKTTMKLELFKKCVDDCNEFPNQIKVLRFVGMGEPLLHKHLSGMIQYASKTNLFERIELITNASLLSPSISNKLISAGLTKILISIQGTSEEKYEEISNIKINLARFIKNIDYFYNHKKDTKIHIKIADCALGDEDDKDRFFNLFGDMCDTIGIEYIGPIHDGVEYNSELQNGSVNQYGAPIVTHTNICAQPFYIMQINPDGNIVPCHSLTYPKIMGNCYTESLFDVWNGKKYHKFYCDMLDGIENVGQPCSKCQIFKHRVWDTDNLQENRAKLKDFYSSK